MNTSPESYSRICDEVWALYTAQLVKDKRRGAKRHVLLPPPPRGRPVDLLFVGISPSQVAPVAYAAERKAAERFAAEFEYVRTAGAGRPKFSNDPYYEPLLQFAQRIDERFGVWPQVASGAKALLVEFTDALHITTDERIADDLLGVMNPQADDCPECLKCKEILKMELALYRPRVVICNGRLPSKFVWEVCTGHPVERPVKETMFKAAQFGGIAHFCGYLNSKGLDGFSRARLLREVRENTQF